MKTYIVLTLLMVISTSLQMDSEREKAITDSPWPQELDPWTRNNGTLYKQRADCDHISQFNTSNMRCLRKIDSMVSWRAAAEIKKCYSKGTYCSNCTTLEHCWDRGRGLEVTDTKICGSGQVCNYLTKKCTNGSSETCEEHSKFVCNFMGMFPDPVLCDRFHFCSSTEAEVVTSDCPNGEYYDPLFATCVLYEKGKETPCPSTEPCAASGTMYPLERNPNIYYICIWEDGNQYVKRMFRCLDDHVFNGETCVPKTPKLEPSLTSGYLSGPI